MKLPRLRFAPMPDTSPPQETARTTAPLAPEPLIGWVTEMRIALANFTCLPAGKPSPETVRPAAAVRVFPVIGALVGLLGAAIYTVADFLGLSAMIASLLAIGTIVAVGRGLHETELATAADRLGSLLPEQSRTILRPSALGPFGILALFFVQSLRVTALSQAGSALDAGLMLVVAACGSRATLPTIMYLVPPSLGEGRDWASGHPDRRRVVDAGALGVLVALALLWPAWWAVVAITAASAMAATGAWLMRRRLGGRSAAALGAVQQLTEVAILVAYVASPSWF